MPLKSIEVYPSKAGKSLLQKEREEEEDEEKSRVGRRVKYSTKAHSDEGWLDKMGETIVSSCKGWGFEAEI